MGLVPQFLSLVPWFVWLKPKGFLLIAWLLCSRGLHSWVLRECNNHRHSSWQATTSKALQRKETETYYSLSVYEVYLFVLELLLSHIEGLQKLFSENRDWRHHLVLSLYLTTTHQYLPKKEIIYSPGALMQLPPRGHLQIAWLWWPAGLMVAVPKNCIYLHSSKATAKGLAFDLGSNWNLPIWNTDWSRHTLKYWKLGKVK